MQPDSLFPELNAARYGDGGPRERLILSKFLVPAAEDFRLRSEHQTAAHAILIRWADLETSGKLRGMTETNLEGEFITEVFSDALGYSLFSENKAQWNIWPKFAVPGGAADAAIGLFDAETKWPPTVLIELKGPTVNVDRDRFGGRTPVQQCWDYLNAAPECPWGIVCNYISFRLYHRTKPPRTYQSFALQELRDAKRFAEFYCLFAHDGLLPSTIGQPPRAEVLLQQTNDRQQEVGGELYRRYQDQRIALIRHLRNPPFEKPLDKAIHAAQVLLDRIIFIAFCEDRDLLPAKSIDSAWREVGAFSLATNPRWERFRLLFRSIDQGNERFGVNRFNGGLFRHDPDVDDLQLDDGWTNFFREVGAYDFHDEVNVDVLGHLFEQSISDLEIVRADPETALAPPPKGTVGQRKREGVYYTPSAITRFLVEETLGPCLQSRFTAVAAEHGIDPAAPDDSNVKRWRKYQLARLAALASVRVCDPACGSGAFLIQAFDYLEMIYGDILNDLAAHDFEPAGWSRQKVKATILRENLFGVDLLEEGVEITRLALWLRTAERGQTLADLSENIRCGNSLIEDADIDPRAFDWSGAFPAVFAAGKFDCVISNPPYIKLQNFRRREPQAAAYLVARYRAAQTGNFDMYLPFIERGLELLNPGGRMGFIAPNIWLYNEYGRGLRELVAEKRALARFIDFKSHQVFADATTYTALQIFSAEPQAHVAVADAPQGDLKDLVFRSVGYGDLGATPWALLGEADRKLVEKMRERSVPLSEATSLIFQGLITSADAVYHLIKLAPGRYYSHSLRGAVELEDDLMKPLVSGEDAIPFATPPTDKYLLFPYLVTDDECRLFTPEEMQRFRRTWQYLRENEKTLRAREHRKFDDDQWYRFGRNQNIDKQRLPKIGVPETVCRLAAFIDDEAKLHFNNVRVNGILEKQSGKPNLWFILGLLNSDALDYVFRLSAKPKDRGYFEANKQFIAPLPIPKTPGGGTVAELAKKLAKLYARETALRRGAIRRLTVDLAPAALIPPPPELVTVPRKLERLETLPAGQLLGEAEKFAKRKFTLAERSQWDAYLTAQCNSLTAVLREIADARAELNDRVVELFGLSESDARHIRSLIPKDA